MGRQPRLGRASPWQCPSGRAPAAWSRPALLACVATVALLVLVNMSVPWALPAPEAAPAVESGLDDGADAVPPLPPSLREAPVPAPEPGSLRVGDDAEELPVARAHDAGAGRWRVVDGDRPAASFVPPLDMSPENLPPHAFVTAPSVALSRGTGAPLACSGRAEGEPARALPFTLVHARTAAGAWAQRARVDGVVGAALAAAGASPFAMVGLSPGRDAVVASVAEAADGSEWTVPKALLVAERDRRFRAMRLTLSVHDGRVFVAITDVPAGSPSLAADRGAQAAGGISDERVRVLSAGAEADLSSPASWSQVPGAADVPDTRQAASMPGGVPGVLESFSWGASASAVPAPGAGASGVSVVASAVAGPRGDVGVLLRQSMAGKLAYDKMVTLPGAHAPFAARFHEPSGYYVALTNAQPDLQDSVTTPAACYARPRQTIDVHGNLTAAVRKAKRHRLAMHAYERMLRVEELRRSAGPGCETEVDETGHAECQRATAARPTPPAPPSTDGWLPCCEPYTLTRECTGRCVWCRKQSRTSLWLVVSRDLAQWRAVAEVATDVSHRADSWASDALFGVQQADFSFAGVNGGSLVAVAAVAEENAYAFDRPVAVRLYTTDWLNATIATSAYDETRDRRQYRARRLYEGKPPPREPWGEREVEAVRSELVVRADRERAENEWESTANVGFGERLFPGSPCLVRMREDGTLLMTHDVYGHGIASQDMVTYVRRRHVDAGEWQLLARVPGMYYATTFELSAQAGVLWMVGVTGVGSPKVSNSMTVAVSRDGGATWAAPVPVPLRGTATPNAWLSAAATPVIEEGGRVWRAMEVYEPACETWARCARLVVFSASIRANLADPRAWSATPPYGWPENLELPGEGIPGVYNATGWLEANIVNVRGGGAALMTRVHSTPRRGLAAVVPLHTKPVNGVPATKLRPGIVSVVRFPGGHSKFVVRLHEPSGYYVALSSATSEDGGAEVDYFPGCYNSPASQDKFRSLVTHGEGEEEAPMLCCALSRWRMCLKKPCVWCRDESRARLWLMVSRDLLHWRPVQELLSDHSSLRGTWMSDLFIGFQYPDFVFDGARGEKLVAAVRTAVGDTERMHDSSEIRIIRSNWLVETLRSAPEGESSDCSLTAVGGAVVCGTEGLEE